MNISDAYTAIRIFEAEVANVAKSFGLVFAGVGRDDDCAVVISLTDPRGMYDTFHIAVAPDSLALMPIAAVIANWLYKEGVEFVTRSSPGQTNCGEEKLRIIQGHLDALCASLAPSANISAITLTSARDSLLLSIGSKGRIHNKLVELNTNILAAAVLSILELVGEDTKKENQRNQEITSEPTPAPVDPEWDGPEIEADIDDVSTEKP